MTSTRNQSVLTRTLNQISASTSSGSSILSPSVSSPTINEIANQPNAGTNPFEKQARGESSNIVTVDESGFTLLSQDAIMRILNIHAEAVIRCVELEDSQEL
jgi:hypothetical protein